MGKKQTMDAMRAMQRRALRTTAEFRRSGRQFHLVSCTSFNRRAAAAFAAGNDLARAPPLPLESRSAFCVGARCSRMRQRHDANARRSGAFGETYEEYIDAAIF
jgi:hypothetical protein